MDKHVRETEHLSELIRDVSYDSICEVCGAWEEVGGIGPSVLKVRKQVTYVTMIETKKLPNTQTKPQVVG